MILHRHTSLRLCFSLWLMALGLQWAHAHPDITEEYRAHIDTTLRVALVTCQPSQHEVYSLYGHTAIHFTDQENGIDVAVNYGVFSLSTPFFPLRFMLGTAEYTMEITPFSNFCYQYAYQRRGIVEQEVDMMAEEKLRFREALYQNYLPENRDYRYDFFYDNCSTRARNIIIRCIGGHLDDGHSDGFQGPSFRDMIHRYNERHPWARFGNDILLGLKADRPTTAEEMQFLPDNLMNDFATARIVDNARGKSRQLVLQNQVVIPYFDQTDVQESPLRPRICFLLLLVLTIALTVAERFFRKCFWLYDALLMTMVGLGGLVLFMMLFSKHPTVGLNLQLLLLNPLPLFLLWRMIRRSIQHRTDRQYVLWILLICLFMVGGLWQQYAEGMYLLASALLVRNVSRLLPLRKR